MRLQSQLTDNRIVVAVDVSVHTVHSLEDLANERSKRFGERDAYEQCKQPKLETKGI